jgi:hypothetical protein
VKAHDDRHHFTQTAPLLSPAVTTPCREQVLPPGGRKLQTEVVNVAEQRYNLHNENPLGHEVSVALTIVLKGFLVAHSSVALQALISFFAGNRVGRESRGSDQCLAQRLCLESQETQALFRRPSIPSVRSLTFSGTTNDFLAAKRNLVALRLSFQRS